jgi:hypothetical protein
MIVELKGGGRGKVDIGADEGICVGMVLKIQGPSPFRGQGLKVVSVEKDSCVIENEQPGGTSDCIEVGAKVVAVKPEIPAP